MRGDVDVGGVGKPLIYTTTKRLLGIKEENKFSLDCKSDPKYHLVCVPESIIREEDPYHACIPTLDTIRFYPPRDIKSQDDFRHGCPPKKGRASERCCSES